MFDSMPVPKIIVSDLVTQPIIAPVLDSLVADKAWSVGEQFIFDSVLYKCTAAISSGGQIVLGSSGNADTASTIVKQIEDVQKWVDVSSEFIVDSGVTCTLMYAYKKDYLVIFSLALTVDTSVSNQMIPLYVNNSIKPKNSTALSVAHGQAGTAINDLTAFLIADGRLVIRTTSGVTNKSVFISGCYLTLDV